MWREELEVGNRGPPGGQWLNEGNPWKNRHNVKPSMYNYLLDSDPCSHEMMGGAKRFSNANGRKWNRPFMRSHGIPPSCLFFFLKKRPLNARASLLQLLLLLVVAAAFISLISLPHSSLLSDTPQFLHSSFPFSVPIPTKNTSVSTINATAAVVASHSNPTLLSEPSPPPPPPPPLLPHYDDTTTSQQQQPYHDWNPFSKDFAQILCNLKIFVYPDVSNHSAPFSKIFLPHPSPFHPKLGNYFSEHRFRINLLHSPFLASHPTQAHFFFFPFSINAMHNDQRLHFEASISDFVAQYTTRISREYRFWNAMGRADHFYVSCHFVGRNAASKHPRLLNNAVRVTCSSSCFQ